MFEESLYKESYFWFWNMNNLTCTLCTFSYGSLDSWCTNRIATIDNFVSSHHCREWVQPLRFLHGCIVERPPNWKEEGSIGIGNGNIRTYWNEDHPGNNHCGTFCTWAINCRQTSTVTHCPVFCYALWQNTKVGQWNWKDQNYRHWLWLNTTPYT